MTTGFLYGQFAGREQPITYGQQEQDLIAPRTVVPTRQTLDTLKAAQAEWDATTALDEGDQCSISKPAATATAMATMMFRRSGKA